MKALRIIVIVIIVAIVAYFIVNSISKAPLTTTTGGNAPITFYCANNQTIQASFTNASSSSSVALNLSDGRSFTLPQVMSGSGARYESTTTDASSTDIVFWNEGNNAFLTENDNTTYSQCTAAIVSPTAMDGVNAYSDLQKTFSFDYPTTFSVAGVDTGYSPDWSALATTSGMVLAKINVPQSYEPGTNFGDAMFTVGTSADPSAVAMCLTNPNTRLGTTTTETINGTSYTKLQYTDVGAGNYYDTTSYRTVRDNQCYAIEYTIHYGNFENYPAGSVQQFDESKVANALDSIAQSFAFSSSTAE